MPHNNTEPPHLLMRSQEVLDFLRISRPTLDQLRIDERLVAYRFGDDRRVLRFRRSEVEALLVPAPLTATKR